MLERPQLTCRRTCLQVPILRTDDRLFCVGLRLDGSLQTLQGESAAFIIDECQPLTAWASSQSVYEIPGPAFRVPTAAIWLNLARLLNTGHLPPYAPTFMVAFGFFFGILSAIKSLSPVLLSRPPRWTKLIPSGIALFVPSICAWCSVQH